MKKILLCVLCLFLLSSCGKAQEQPVVIADDGGEGETFTIPYRSEITADETLDAAQITCKPLHNADGDHNGFEMRFPKTDALDTMLSDPANLYFGCARNGKCYVSVPTESVRILVDGETNEFVVTMLIPVGELTGNACSVSFLLISRSDPTHALFCAEKDVSNYL